VLFALGSPERVAWAGELGDRDQFWALLETCCGISSEFCAFVSSHLVLSVLVFILSGQDYQDYLSLKSELN